MADPRLNRRQFLGVMGLGAAVLAASKTHALDFVNRLPRQGNAENTGTASLSQNDVLAQIRANIAPHFEGKAMGLDFRRVNLQGETDFTIQINADAYYPTASAFKAFLTYYYFRTIPVEEWQVGPKDPLYRVSVFSNNYLTGVLLWEVGQRIPGEGNAIEKFNDFLLNECGMTYGIYTWSWPSTPTRGLLDQRFAPRKEWSVEVRQGSSLAENVSTAEDLARGWLHIAAAEQDPRWETDDHFKKAILATRELLSIPAVSYRSPIERVVYGGYIGKDGTLPLGDFVLGRVINDAGLVRVADGFYIVSFMSTGETEQSTTPALSEVIASINVYQEYLNPYREPVITGLSVPLIWGENNYGFTRTNTIELYLEPDSQAPRVDNPVRRTSTFGTPYVMRGSLLRFTPVDENWGRLIVDNREDDVFTYKDWSFAFQQANWLNWEVVNRPDIYVPLDKLMVASREHFTAIDYALDWDAPPQKWLLLHVPKRQLTLFEGLTPIIKTPLVLNSLATPRGRLYVNRVMIARNMPTYPGVPYTNFLHNGSDLHEIGYAIHGAPWHVWEQSVTEWETIRRFSAGCINIPSWSLPIGRYEMPVDEFIFRWIGGFPDPSVETSYFKPDVIRVMSVNNAYEDLFYFSVIDAVLGAGGNWNDAIRAWEAKTVDAPERFFVNPFDRENANANILNLQAATDDE